MKIALASISGFAQPKSVSNGAAVIAEAAEDLPGVTVYLRKHNASAEQLAVTLAHENQFDRLVFFAHSHGATMACDCIRKLQEFNRVVRYVIFADGWNGSGVLTIPANVYSLETWIQNLNRPARKRRPHGSEIRRESTQTKWREHQAAIEIGHNKIDGLPEVRDAVLRACEAT